MGLMENELGEWDSTPDLSKLVDKLLEERKIAAQKKDYTKADELRAIYQKAGLEVRITKGGVDLVATAGFDVADLNKLL